MWLSSYYSDYAFVQVREPGFGWQTLPFAVNGYTTMSGPNPAWEGQKGYRSGYEFFAADMSGWIGKTVEVRIGFWSNTNGYVAGAYIDDLRLDEESTDTDMDGILGVINEANQGADPYLADTDGDGANDGAEIAAMTNPRNPSWSPSTTAMAPGDNIDFEAADKGGCYTEGTLWEWGTPTSGPGRANSGTRVWGTRLGGNFFGGANERLYCKPLDLTNTTAATLSFRVWNRISYSDGLGVEVREPGLAWQALNFTTAYNGSLGGTQVWERSFGYQGNYELVAADLTSFAGKQLEIRFVYRTNTNGYVAGGFIDDIRLDDESADPDGDMVSGVIAEMASGTDPYLADSDADGVLDGPEQVDGTNPNNPADYSGAVVWTADTFQNFENIQAGGFKSNGTLWRHGIPTTGPAAAHSGSRVWATNLTGNYFGGANEFLYSPRIDLTTAVSPTLAMRLVLSTSYSDGLVVEVRTGNSAWGPLPFDVHPYQTSLNSTPVWTSAGSGSTYQIAIADLSFYTGTEIELRVRFMSNTNGYTPGAFIDDVSVTEETSDPDSDGIIGVLGEYQAYGTDPFDGDTDGDGTNDGADADPLNPGVQ